MAGAIQCMLTDLEVSLHCVQGVSRIAALVLVDSNRYQVHCWYMYGEIKIPLEGRLAEPPPTPNKSHFALSGCKDAFGKEIYYGWRIQLES